MAQFLCTVYFMKRDIIRKICVPLMPLGRLFFSTKFWRILGPKPPVGSVFWEISEFFSSKLLSFLWKFTHFRYFCLSFLSKSQLLLSYWWFLSFWPALPPFSVQEKTKNWLFTSSFPQMPPVVWVFSFKNPSVFLALSFFGCSVFLKRRKKSLI